ncbi:hypothetical protein ColTof4_03142 [Colletotrichum tofieldiae]|nr:hypothetical protein ColTof3_13448 [Colletotrichum tofieldiae]GKT70719.1 hypothetical protein ColTof4_03142 [Colletotrichum tofieldiae]GKT94387.1 hypothetical protein Ct61P_12237 [Colletotrichum tofieldiae]
MQYNSDGEFNSSKVLPMSSNARDGGYIEEVHAIDDHFPKQPPVEHVWQEHELPGDTPQLERSATDQAGGITRHMVKVNIFDLY